MKKQWSVGMLVFDQVDAFDFVGPSEILSVARYSAQDVQNMILGSVDQQHKPFLVYTVSETGGMVTPATAFALWPTTASKCPPI